MAAATARNPLRRVRHIHIPDLPPAYAPLRIPQRIQAAAETHIRTKGAIRAHESLHPEALPYWYTPTPNPTWRPKQIRFWAVRASPPPTVLTYTSQPVFAQVRVGEDLARVAAAKSPLAVEFARPAGWTPEPWEPVRQRLGGVDEAWERRRGDSLKGVFARPEMVPFSEERRQLVNGETDVAAQPTYQGPGVLSIVTSFDVYEERDPDVVARKTVEFHELVERTTIAVLAYEYGLEASRVRDQPGLWVPTQHHPSGHNDQRQIATIQHQQRDGVIRFRIALHIGTPSIADVLASTREPSPFSSPDHTTNPWARLSPAHQRTVTSVAAELNAATAAHCAARGGPSPSVRYSQTTTTTAAAVGGSRDPFSLVHWKGKNQHAGGFGTAAFPAPLGLDNYDVASAWAFEFAAQLGIEHVDQLTRQSRFATCDVSARRDAARLTTLPGVLVTKGEARRGEEGEHGPDELMRRNATDIPWPKKKQQLAFTGWDVFLDAVERVLRHANSEGTESRGRQKDTRMVGFGERSRKTRADPAVQKERRELSRMALPASSRPMESGGI